MDYTREKLDAAKAAGPCVVDEIQEPSNWKAPVCFSCTSGVLLWGKLQAVMAGSVAKDVDTSLCPSSTDKPFVDNHSTILQSSFRYRVLARKGLWKVEAVFTGRSLPVGYVCHHVDASGPDLLRRAALVGVSSNDHADRDIVCINRFDWARIDKEDLRKEEDLEDFEEEDERDYMYDEDEDDDFLSEDEEEYEQDLMSNRFMLVDRRGYSQLVQSLRNGFKVHSKNHLFRDGSNPLPQGSSFSSDTFGVNLGVGDAEVELGWMTFQRGELVGFVYDGSYCIHKERHFQCGDTKVSELDNFFT